MDPTVVRVVTLYSSGPPYSGDTSSFVRSTSKTRRNRNKSHWRRQRKIIKVGWKAGEWAIDPWDGKWQTLIGLLKLNDSIIYKCHVVVHEDDSVNVLILFGFAEASITSSGSTCSICLINFTTSALLGDHTEGCHTNNLSKKYNCEGCKAGFEVLRDLYAHQKDCLVFLGLKKTTADSQYIVKFWWETNTNLATFVVNIRYESICSGIKYSRSAVLSNLNASSDW